MIVDVTYAVNLFHSGLSPICMELLIEYICKQSNEWKDLFHELK